MIAHLLKATAIGSDDELMSRTLFTHLERRLVQSPTCVWMMDHH
jgi:hypothetical protein